MRAVIVKPCAFADVLGDDLNQLDILEAARDRDLDVLGFGIHWEKAGEFYGMPVTPIKIRCVLGQNVPEASPMPAHPLAPALLALLLVFPAAGEERFAGEIASVESIRGREFTAEVKHVRLERAKLREFLRAQIDRDLPIGAEGYLEALKAVYLIAPGVTMEPLLDLYDAQVLAFYDPATHVYYSLDEPPKNVPMPEQMVEAVEVHELMHALQDQAFGAGSRTIELQADWDAALAYQSLLEGEAVLVMLAHLGSKLGVGLEAMVAQEGMIDALREAAARGDSVPPGIPSYFVDSLQFPYVEGLAFVLEAFKAGGWKALDSLHADPPRSTEEILRPDLYRLRVSGESGGRARPAEKPADGELLRTALGEFHWSFLLGKTAGEGWGSDRVVIRRSGAGTTVLVDSSWDSETDAREFAAAIEKMLAEKKAKNVRVERTGLRVLAGWGRDAEKVREFVARK